MLHFLELEDLCMRTPPVKLPVSKLESAAVQSLCSGRHCLQPRCSPCRLRGQDAPKKIESQVLRAIFGVVSSPCSWCSCFFFSSAFHSCDCLGHTRLAQNSSTLARICSALSTKSHAVLWCPCEQPSQQSDIWLINRGLMVISMLLDVCQAQN